MVSSTDIKTWMLSSVCDLSYKG